MHHLRLALYVRRRTQESGSAPDACRNPSTGTWARLPRREESRWGCQHHAWNILLAPPSKRVSTPPERVLNWKIETVRTLGADCLDV